MPCYSRLRAKLLQTLTFSISCNNVLIQSANWLLQGNSTSHLRGAGSSLAAAPAPGRAALAGRVVQGRASISEHKADSPGRDGQQAQQGRVARQLEELCPIHGSVEGCFCPPGALLAPRAAAARSGSEQSQFAGMKDLLAVQGVLLPTGLRGRVTSVVWSGPSCTSVMEDAVALVRLMDG